ncbi:MAG: hypothetical protein AB1351_03075 [Thermoproteota archaeon]
MQAIYVLKALEEGKSEKEIIELFGNDKQIVDIWMNFLAHNRWMEHPNGHWQVTAKGKMWIAKRSQK